MLWQTNPTINDGYNEQLARRVGRIQSSLLIATHWGGDIRSGIHSGIQHSDRINPDLNGYWNKYLL